MGSKEMEDIRNIMDMACVNFEKASNAYDSSDKNVELAIDYIFAFENADNAQSDNKDKLIQLKNSLNLRKSNDDNDPNRNWNQKNPVGSFMSWLNKNKDDG